MLSLIADCGSTKTEWALIDHSSPGSPVKVFRTTGFNAAVTPVEEITRILTSGLAPEVNGLNVGKLHFYGAGCIGGETDRRLANVLSTILPEAEIEVSSDLLAAARALFGSRPGIACILGTGSNSGLYDGTRIIANTPPMGFILGDEGSGAVLGRNLVNHIFKYPGNLPNAIIDDFNATFRLSKADIIERVYRRPEANRFLASLTPFLKKHIDNPAVHSLVRDSFLDFINANLPGYFHDIDSLPVCSASAQATTGLGFVGSIAFHFSRILNEVCRQCDLPSPEIIQAPLPSLIQYHYSIR